MAREWKDDDTLLTMNVTYKNTVVGGTFDHFHKGHQKLLDVALGRSENITIGVSTEVLYKDKAFSSEIEQYNIRLAAVEKYIRTKEFRGVYNFVAIDDIFGTTLKQREIDAIFVTEDNKNAAEVINTKRLEKHFLQLAVQRVPLVKGTDGKVISSERIRRGEIDRNGLCFASLFEHNLELPSRMRSMLREPIGTVSKDIHEIISYIGNASIVISVGDIVSMLLAEAGHQAALSVIDFKTRRRELNSEQKTLLKQLSSEAISCSNKAGMIEHEAVAVITNATHRYFQTTEKQTIRIAGEEDLLTLPAILLAPLGGVVIYGQFEQGAVFVRVTEAKKAEILSIVNEFEKTNLASIQE